jgi:hypothetical protein
LKINLLSIKKLLLLSEEKINLHKLKKRKKKFKGKKLKKKKSSLRMKFIN